MTVWTSAIWAAATAASIAAIVYGSTLYHIEAAKQEGFMMNACASAGGDWQRSWNNRPSCTRPTAQK